MKYVLDSNVALKWVLPELGSSKAIRIRDEFRQGLHELSSPDIFAVEIAHSLARAERRGIIQPSEGAMKMADIFTFMPALFPHLPLLPRAFALSSHARIGVYDCLYVALAEREGCTLLTADDRLVKNLKSHSIVLLSSLP